MSASFNTKVLSQFKENPTGELEYKTENRLVFLALHALGKKALRVTTDSVRISWHYLDSDVREDVDRVMTGLVNGVSGPDEDAYKVDITRLLIAWSVWETYLNQMRDYSRANRHTSVR